MWRSVTKLTYNHTSVHTEAHRQPYAYSLCNSDWRGCTVQSHPHPPSFSFFYHDLHNALTPQTCRYRCRHKLPSTDVTAVWIFAKYKEGLAPLRVWFSGVRLVRAPPRLHLHGAEWSRFWEGPCDLSTGSVKYSSNINWKSFAAVWCCTQTEIVVLNRFFFFYINICLHFGILV